MSSAATTYKPINLAYYLFWWYFSDSICLQLN